VRTWVDRMMRVMIRRGGGIHLDFEHWRGEVVRRWGIL
jgi:hypothetical protein